MASNWKVRIMMFVRAADNTPENRQAFGAIFANNGSGETPENESKLFDSAVKLSVSGGLPAQVYGLETALFLPDMRDDMLAFLDILSQSRYYVIANIELDQYFTGELIKDNCDPTLVGTSSWDVQPFTMQDAMNDIFIERGLQVINE